MSTATYTHGCAAADNIVNAIVEKFSLENPAPQKYEGGTPGLGGDGYSFIEVMADNWRFRPMPSFGDWPMLVLMRRAVDPADHEYGDGEGGEFRQLLAVYCEGGMTLTVFETLNELRDAANAYRADDEFWN